MASGSAQSVLDYWFEPGKSFRWFAGGKEVDLEIKEKFGNLVGFLTGFFSLVLNSFFIYKDLKKSAYCLKDHVVC